MSQTITQFRPLYKPNQLIVGTGTTAIVTGWTVRASIAKALEPHEYAAIGQLYSPARGIDFLVRNLLANPHVRDVILLSGTKEDKAPKGCECLRDFFTHGFELGQSDTGRSCWVVRSATPGYIDIEIPPDALEKLRAGVKAHYFTDRLQAIAHAKFLGNGYAHATTGGTAPKPWGPPLEFPKAEIQPTILPGHRYGHRVEGRTIAECWVKIIHRIKTTGTIRPTGYDGSWQELIDLTAIVTAEPEGFYWPEPNFLPVDPDFLTDYLPSVIFDSPHLEGTKYTYGQRLRSWFGRDQVEQVIHKLINEIDAASAVLNLWDVEDHDRGGSPCLNHIWVRVVDDELSLTATFRSNDMFAAWPANAMGLRELQAHILDRVMDRSEHRLRLGPLITISQSAHIYDDCWENADTLIREHYYNSRRDYDDPAGDYVISLDGKEIVVERCHHEGSTVATYRGYDPLRLARSIATDAPALHPDHAIYLGIELEKARIAMELGAEYRQDQALPPIA